MKLKDEIYDTGIVKKPWGFEYVLLRDKNSVSVTFLNIDYKKQTSLHCHPKKKTGFIILKGNAQVQYGIYKENNKKYKPLSRLVMRPGLFHSIKSTSKSGLIALELESPVDKNDLIRFKDNYGRESKSYEGKNYIKNSFKKKFVMNFKSYKELYKYLKGISKDEYFNKMVKIIDFYKSFTQTTYYDHKWAEFITYKCLSIIK